MDGLAFLESFADRDFEVILTTAHSKYAIDAIRKKVFDYLVKPITRSALESALNRLVYHRSPEEIYPELIPKPTSPLTEIETRIRLDVDRKVLFIEPADIIYCESDGNYCRVYLERDKSIFLTRKLKAVGLLLPPQQFLRVHKSYIVNLKKIKEYHRVENYLVLNTDKYIPVSQKLRGYFT